MTPHHLVRAPALYCLGAFSCHILTLPLDLFAGAPGENILLYLDYWNMLQGKGSRRSGMTMLYIQEEKMIGTFLSEFAG